MALPGSWGAPSARLRVRAAAATGRVENVLVGRKMWSGVTSSGRRSNEVACGFRERDGKHFRHLISENRYTFCRKRIWKGKIACDNWKMRDNPSELGGKTSGQKWLPNEAVLPCKKIRQSENTKPGNTGRLDQESRERAVYVGIVDGLNYTTYVCVLCGRAEGERSAAVPARAQRSPSLPASCCCAESKPAGSHFIDAKWLFLEAYLFAKALKTKEERDILTGSFCGFSELAC